MSRDVLRSGESELDPRASDWLDDGLDAASRAEFEAELDADPALAREVKELEVVVRGLRRLPAVDAPPDLLRGVQHRIRRRSRGRYFGNRSLHRYRFPYEAVVNGILLGLLMAVYIIAMPTPDDVPVPAPSAEVERVDPVTATAFLERFGDVAVEATDGDAVVLRVTPEPRLLAALQLELERRPTLEVVELVAATPDAPALVRVRVRPAP